MLLKDPSGVGLRGTHLQSRDLDGGSRGITVSLRSEQHSEPGLHETLSQKLKSTNQPTNQTKKYKAPPLPSKPTGTGSGAHTL